MSTMSQKFMSVLCRKHTGASPPPTSTYHLVFDGVDDKITIPHAASIDNLPLGDFTVEFVARILQPGVSGFILAKNNAASWRGFGIWVESSTEYGPTLSLYIADDTDKYLGFDCDFPQFDNNFHHYEINLSLNTRTPRLLIDGVMAVIAQFDDNGGAADDSAHDMIICSDDESTFSVLSSVGYLRISNIVRHTSNFTPPSLAVCPPADANTILRLALDEGTGTTANDTSGTNNNGTIDGATWEAD